MADYYPLLARAVTGLQNSTSEARRAIYERARNALLGQLRGITPALPEQDIERESDALDAAVRRLEEELATEASKRERSAAGSGAPTASQRRPRREGPLRPISRDGVDSEAGAGTSEGNGETDASVRRAGRRRTEPMHPAAPTMPMPRQSKARIWIFGATIVAVVAMIGATAYFLRDDPQDLGRSKPIDTVPPVTAAAGKITGRAAGSGGKAAATSPVPAKSVAVVPIEVPSSGSKPVPAIPPGRGAGSPGTQSGAAPRSQSGVPNPPAPGTANAGSEAAAPRQPVVPVTYRAALLVQGDKRDEHKTYVGTVIWRLDSVSGDPGQPLQTALRADIDIPDAKLKVSMQLQKNTDPALSASHTLVLGFIQSSDSVIKGIRSIQMPQMRDETAPGGEAFLGIGIVPITPTYYLVGLQQGEASVKRNFDLLTTRNWFDVQFVLDNGRAAKITFEKGAQGESALKDAIAAWR